MNSLEHILARLECRLTAAEGHAVVSVHRNARLSSASAGVKFSEGNRAGIRGVRVQQTVLTNVNRGFVFSTTLGGDISDVVLSDLSIHCNRFDWF